MIVSLYLFWIGGITYQIIEILWSRHTHWSMFFAGGFCIILADGIFNAFHSTIPNFLIIILSGTGITCIEYLLGCIFNLKLKMNVWDYSSVKGNILGQICPLYTLYWCLLSIPAIGLAELIRSLFN